MELWIARDRHNALKLYSEKPIFDITLGIKLGFTEDYYIGDINSDLFPTITWENSPQKVELKLI